MRRALMLAEQGRGCVEPNPVVGCVVVRGGRVIGEGFHRRFGGPHAEVEALRKAGPKARGATVFVTLEPCCHHGKTGPCTDALIEAGVARVVVACKDPFPQVRGKGLERLRAAGMEVKVGLCREEAQTINAPFFKRIQRGLPYVIAKWAMTLDGAIATSSGESKWISNAESRLVVHELRGRVDAIVVGIGTALADDPLLTARGRERTRERPRRPSRVARRVVIDPSLRLPVRSKLAQTVGEAPLTILTRRNADVAKVRRLEKLGVEVIELPSRRGERLDLKRALRHFVEAHDSTNILVEGGGQTLGAFFEQGLVDEALVFIGPRILGDGGAVRPVVRAVTRGPVNLAGAVPLNLLDSRNLGGDLMLRYRLLK